MSVPAPEETSGFSLIITVTVQPDKYDEWLRLSWETFKLVTAETDCLSFEMFSVPGEPNKVKWVESWSKSLEAVMAVSFSSSPCSVVSDTVQQSRNTFLPVGIGSRLLGLSLEWKANTARR